jgi:hypothetical protein
VQLDDLSAAVGVDHRPLRDLVHLPPVAYLALAGRQASGMLSAMASLRVAIWNIAGARREGTDQVDLDAVVAGVRALGVDLLAA